MRKIIKLLSVLMVCMMMCSCIDYVQSVNYKNGKYQLYYKVTLSKLLFALAQQDPEEMFRGFDEETFEELPPGYEVKPVNTELEVGAEILLSIDPKTDDESEKDFLPTVASNKCYIPFLLGENKSIADSYTSDDEYQAIAEAMLSSAKCRILIAKNIIPSIELAYFEGKGSQSYSIPVYDYGDCFCLEIPFIILCRKPIYRTDRIVIIK